MEPASLNLSDRGLKHFREERINLQGAVNTKATVNISNDYTIIGEILNISKHGARLQFQAKDAYFRNDIPLYLELEVDGALFYSGHAKIPSDFIEDGGTLSFGITYLDGTVDISKIKAKLTKEYAESIDHFQAQEKSFSLVHSEFKTLFMDFLITANSVNSELKKIESTIRSKKISGDVRDTEFRHVVDIFHEQTKEVIFDKLLVLGNYCKEISNDSRAIIKNFIQSFLDQDFILKVPFMARARLKPLGYAGDFGLMKMLYDYEDMGEDLVAKFWHRQTCFTPIAIANKNRVNLLAAQLHQIAANCKEDSLKIVSLACGPAKELENFLSSPALRTNLNYEIILLDSDQAALTEALSNIKRASRGKDNIQVKGICEDGILGVIKGKEFVSEFHSSDIIISAGLFDYLSDRVAERLILCLSRFLAPKGTMLIGNVSSDNPDVFALEFFMEWNLVMRSASDLLKLAPSGFQSSVIEEHLGLNLFLKIEND